MIDEVVVPPRIVGKEEFIAEGVELIPSINEPQGALILIDKPYGITSFDAVYKIKRTLRLFSGDKKVKVGHGGTLDPLATGLLIICTGKFTKKINELSKRARENKLKPEDLEGGTYSFSNIGTFGNIMGTPIIMQPQVAIMAFGAIQKKPAVIETPQGDLLGIRQKMFISHSYDHRVVDGSLGGQFVKRVSDYLEGFEIHRKL